MVRFVRDRLGWAADRFQGHRCRVDYLVYDTQVNMVLRPPSVRSDD